MLRMNEVNEVDHQTMQHMLTEAVVDWDGFGDQIARDTDALVGGSESVLIFDEGGFAKKGQSSAGVARQWNSRQGKVDISAKSAFLRPCVGGKPRASSRRLSENREPTAEKPILARFPDHYR